MRMFHSAMLLALLPVASTAIPHLARADCAPNAILGSPITVDSHQTVTDLAIADLNADGKNDLLVEGPAGLSVLLAVPMPQSVEESFSFAGLIPVGGTAITVADLNDDQIADIVVCGGSSTFNVLLGVGDGTFSAPTTYSVPSTEWSYRAVAGDFDGNGTTDLAMVSDETGYNDWFRIRLWSGNGSGAFSLAAAATTYGVSPFRIPKPDVVGHDVNGDGLLDIAVAENTGGVSIFVANGSLVAGSWLTERISLIPDRGICHATDNYWDFRFCFADVSGDGIDDIVYLNRCTGELQASLLDGASLPNFSSRLLGGAGTLTVAVGAADLDGDGQAEVLDSNDAGIVTNKLLEQTQGDALVAVDSILVGGARILKFDDLDGDGTPDLVIGRGANPGIVVRFGRCVEARPAIVAVSDVPQDQGGQVKVSWAPSGGDGAAGSLVNQYWVWRAVPPNLAAQAASRARPVGQATAVEHGGIFSRREQDGPTTYWEFVKDMPASGLDGYGAVCETTGDSSTVGNALTQFFVQARTRVGPWVWASDPMAGYSVDNLAPAIPSPFAGVYGAGGTALHWAANTETDIAGYRLYRGEALEFEPGPTNLVAAQKDTGYFDAGGVAGAYYKLAALDIHGNVSKFAVVAPDAATATLASLQSVEVSPGRVSVVWVVASEEDVAVYRRRASGQWLRRTALSPDGEHRVVFEDDNVEAGEYDYRLGLQTAEAVEIFGGLVHVTVPQFDLALSAARNPTDGGLLRARITLPSAGRALLQLLDISGRILRSQDVSGLGPGEHIVVVADEGRVPPGLYFIRLVKDRAQRVVRLAVVR